MEPIVEKWNSFGWEVYLIDGHDFSQLNKIFDEVFQNKLEKPSMIIAKTIKGKSVFHGKPSQLASWVN